MIELINIPISIYGVKVRIYLALKGLEYEQILPPGGFRSAEYRRHVPAGTIPAIRIGDFVLHDSGAILEYFEECYPDPPLLPSAPRERAKLRALANFHDTKLEATIRTCFPLFSVSTESRRAELSVFSEAMADAMARLDAMVDPQPFLGGTSISLADCGYPTTLRMGERMMAALDAPMSMSAKINRWLVALEANEIVNRHVREYLVTLDQWIEEEMSEKNRDQAL